MRYNTTHIPIAESSKLSTAEATHEKNQGKVWDKVDVQIEKIRSIERDLGFPTNSLKETNPLYLLKDEQDGDEADKFIHQITIGTGMRFLIGTTRRTDVFEIDDELTVLERTLSSKIRSYEARWGSRDKKRLGLTYY